MCQSRSRWRCCSALEAPTYQRIPVCCRLLYHLQTLAVSLHDVSEPQPLALPGYTGEIYIYVALVLGGVWMFSTAPLIIILGVMVVSRLGGGGDLPQIG